MAERDDLSTRPRLDDGLERSAAEIRQDIAAKRETISDTVDRLGERIHQTLDWREYIVDHPYAALGVAAGLGFLVSGVFKRNPPPGDRIMDALAETVEDFGDRVRGVMGDLPFEGSSKKLGPGKTVKAAVVAMITKSAIDFAKNKVTDVVVKRYVAPRTQASGQTSGHTAGKMGGGDQPVEVVEIERRV